MIHHDLNFFNDIYNTINGQNQRQTHYLHGFQIILVSIFMWIKKFSYNFICCMINHISMLSLIECITHSSSFSMKEMKLYVIIMLRTSFRVNPHYVVWLNVKELPASSRHHIWSLSDSNGIRTHNHLVCKWKLNHLWFRWLWVRILLLSQKQSYLLLTEFSLCQILFDNVFRNVLNMI